MFLYFAYGSCMGHRSLSETLGMDVKDNVIGFAYLDNYSLKFNYPDTNGVEHYCNIVNDNAGQVEGTLFELPESVLEPLREREEVDQGRYHEQYVSVTCGDQQYSNVLTYQASVVSCEEGFPGQRYISLLERGFIDAGVSEGYRAEVMQRLTDLKIQFEERKLTVGQV